MDSTHESLRYIYIYSIFGYATLQENFSRAKMQPTMLCENVNAPAEVRDENVELVKASDSAVDSVICSPRLSVSDVVSSSVPNEATPDLCRAPFAARSLFKGEVSPLAEQDLHIQPPSLEEAPSPAGTVVEAEDKDGFKRVSRKKAPKKRVNSTHSVGSKDVKDAKDSDASLLKMRFEMSEAQTEAPREKEKKGNLNMPKVAKPVNPFQDLEDEGEQLPEAEDEVCGAHKRKNRGKRKAKKVALQSLPDMEAVAPASKKPAFPETEEISSSAPDTSSSPDPEAEVMVESTPAAEITAASKPASATVARIRLAVCGTCIAVAGGLLMWQVYLL